MPHIRFGTSRPRSTANEPEQVDLAIPNSQRNISVMSIHRCSKYKLLLGRRTAHVLSTYLRHRSCPLPLTLKAMSAAKLIAASIRVSQYLERHVGGQPDTFDKTTTHLQRYNVYEAQSNYPI
jgi:hypothetical protein